MATLFNMGYLSLKLFRIAEKEEVDGLASGIQE